LARWKRRHDANGQSVNDAQVLFDLDMTTMSHGKNIVAAATGQWSLC